MLDTFWEEYGDSDKHTSLGTVVHIRRELQSGLYEAITGPRAGAINLGKRQPVQMTMVSKEYLETRCKPVSREDAARMYPEVLEYHDSAA